MHQNQLAVGNNDNNSNDDKNNDNNHHDYLIYGRQDVKKQLKYKKLHCLINYNKD